MDESFLLKAAACTVILGLLGLFVVLQTGKAKDIEGNNIENARDGDTVKLQGRIAFLDQRENFTKITLEHTCQTNAILFDAPDLAKGDFIEVEGKPQENTFLGKKERQILADKITLIR